jgi:hypothetical protein
MLQAKGVNLLLGKAPNLCSIHGSGDLHIFSCSSLRRTCQLPCNPDWSAHLQCRGTTLQAPGFLRAPGIDAMARLQHCHKVRVLTSCGANLERFARQMHGLEVLMLECAGCRLRTLERTEVEWRGSHCCRGADSGQGRCELA